MKLWQAKLKAFSIHLLLSAIVIALFLLWVTQVWFPGPLFKLENVWQGLQILIPVDAILGPILTLVLFVPGKKNLKLDLAVIALFQLGALVYGGAMIYSQRPAVIAFVVDRLQIATVSEAYIDDIPLDKFDEQSYPIMTYVLPPQTPQENSDFITSGIKFEEIGERHLLMNQHLAEIEKKALNFNQFKISNESTRAKLEAFSTRNSNIDKLILLPLQGSNKETIVVALDKNSGEIVDSIEISPWSEYSSKND